MLLLLVDGAANREIADALGISSKTVMHHTVAIYRKLGVRGRTEAATWAVRTGLHARPADRPTRRCQPAHHGQIRRQSPGRRGVGAEVVIGRDPRRDGDGHGGGGLPHHRDVVVRAVEGDGLVDRGAQRARTGPGQAHVAAGEAADRLAEDRREVLHRLPARGPDVPRSDDDRRSPVRVGVDVDEADQAVAVLPERVDLRVEPGRSRRMPGPPAAPLPPDHPPPADPAPAAAAAAGHDPGRVPRASDTVVLLAPATPPAAVRRCPLATAERLATDVRPP